MLSASVANLPNHLRYRTQNLKLYGLTPGPAECTADELQHFMRNLVDDLIRLYEHGIWIKTPSCPNGKNTPIQYGL